MCASPVIATVEATVTAGTKCARFLPPAGARARFELHACGALIVRFTGGGGGLWAHLSSYSAGDPAGHVASLVAAEGWKVAA